MDGSSSSATRQSASSSPVKLEPLTERLQAVSLAGQQLLGAETCEHLARAVRDQARSSFGSRAVWILIFDKQRDLLVPCPPGADNGGGSLSPGQGLAGKAFEQSRALLLSDLRGEPLLSSGPLQSVGPLAAFPLLAKENRLGVLVLDVGPIVDESSGLDTTDIALLRVFASQVAAAHESLAARQEAGQSLRQLQALVDSAACGLAYLDGDGYVRLANPQVAEYFGLTPDQVLARHRSELEHIFGPEAQGPQSNQDNPPSSSSGSTSLDLIASGTRKLVRVRSPLGPDEGSSGELVTFLDHSGHEQAKSDLQSLNEHFAALNDLLVEVNESADLPAVLEAALDKALDLVGAHAGGVYLIEARSQRLGLAAHRNFSEALLERIGSYALGEGLNGRVAQTGDPIVSNYISTDDRIAPQLKDVVEAEQWHSVSCVPIRSKQRIIGTLFAATRDQIDLDDSSLELLTEVGNAIGPSIATAILFDEQRRTSEALAALDSICDIALSGLTLPDLLTELLERMVHAAAVDGGRLLLVDKQLGRLRAVASHAFGEEPSGFTLGMGEGFTGRVWAEGRTLELSDAQEDPSVGAHIKEKGVRSMLGTPLRVNGEIIGAVHIYSKSIRSFSNEQKRLLEILADRAAAFIQTARLAGENEQKLRRLGTLQEIAHVANTSAGFERLANDILGRLAASFDVPIGALWLTEPETRELEALVVHGLPDSFWQHLRRISLDDLGQPGSGADESSSRVVNDGEAQSLPRIWNTFAQLGTTVRSLAVIPLSANGKIRGVLCLASPARHAFRPDDLGFYETIGSQAAVALRKSLLLDQSHARAGQLERLHQLTLEFNQEGDPEKLLSLVLRRAAELVDARAGAVFRLEGQRLHMSAFYTTPGYPHQCLIDGDSMPFRLEGAGYSRAMREKRAVRIDGLQDYTEIGELPSGHIPMRGLLTVPLLGPKAEPIGAFLLTDKADGATFTAEDEDLAAILSTHAAVALANARKFQREHRLSQALQSALLPQIPNLDGVEFGLIYEPAADSRRLGGDFCDVIRLADDRFAVVIGDACGKGLEATSDGAMVKHMLRAFLTEGLGSSVCLQRVNEALCRLGDTVPFVTAGVAVIDLRSRTVDWANAGHPPPLYLTQSRGFVIDRAGGIPLGVDEDEHFDEVRFRLDGDGTLIFYTDGLIEAKGPDGLYGMPRLQREAAENRDARPSQLANYLVSSAKIYAGRLGDDIAVLTLRTGAARRS